MNLRIPLKGEVDQAEAYIDKTIGTAVTAITDRDDKDEIKSKKNKTINRE